MPCTSCGCPWAENREGEFLCLTCQEMLEQAWDTYQTARMVEAINEHWGNERVTAWKDLAQSRTEVMKKIVGELL